MLGQRVLPLECVGIYVPGGKASYPSSVLMNAVPAKVAGVPKVVMCVPAPGGKLNPGVLVAADLAGVDEIYKVGGAQAVAAMAYGTKTIPRVDKIVGPGNIYVATAKRLVFGAVDIDMVAGPSEILVVADKTANPAFVAADMLSQAEHDEMASAVLVTDSPELADAVKLELDAQVKELPRRKVAEKSLADFGAIILVRDLQEAAEIANRIAPEHLELSVDRPMELLPKTKKRGRDIHGPLYAGGRRRLLRGSEPRPSHGRDGQVFLAAFHGRFREEVERPDVYERGAGRTGPRRAPYSEDGRAGRACPHG